MKTNQNTAIIMMLISAAILSAVLVGTYTNTSQRAYADTGTRDGDYTMAAGMYASDRDLLYIIDIANQKLNVYVININTRAIEFGDSVDLRQIFSGA